ncbi:MAG: non-hydrolyzing UDP-N-acetylglucosamine 2-epimerase [bacterium]
MKIVNVAGARPNFIKIAPIIYEMKKHPEIQAMLVHTGQHYDDKMSKAFFQDLEIPEPDVHLNVGSGSHAQQTAKVMIGFEEVLLKERPDLVLVVGDVNSTLACALTAVKMHIPVAHVEAGLRSFDRTMPEEINRILTDSISDFLFITSKEARENLMREGIPEGKIFFVGNVMIDTLLRNKDKIAGSRILSKLNLKQQEYAVLTLHRPSNVDSKEDLEKIMSALYEVQKNIKIIFPIHPRTLKTIQTFNLNRKVEDMENFITIDPLGYLDFLKLLTHAKFVLTDSGGIQEETTVLRVPCLTLRNNTERPVTVGEGTNILVGTNPENIVKESLKVLKGRGKVARTPELWDGNASRRIVEILLDRFKS